MMSLIYPLPDLNVPADHGGGLDAAIARFGGDAAEWLDLSTGINPRPCPLPAFTAQDWNRLPDQAAFAKLETAARDFWRVPEGAAVLAAPGASSLIARIPALLSAGQVDIPGPTYNEHARAFAAAGWQMGKGRAKVLVHPNNPDGRLWTNEDLTAPFMVIDESFCDVTPDDSLIHLAVRPGTLILKSFGKFWGLAGLRLGFAIGDPALITRLGQMIGPWAVSGPALRVGALALQDKAWADATRLRLVQDAARLDRIVGKAARGTSLFRLFQVGDAQHWQDHLAKAHIWTRVFPYDPTWLRLGLPGDEKGWLQLEQAMKGLG
jgi:cobalamin biosynthetic protein CobC